MGMPIAVDPDIWAFAVDQMERPDTRSGMEVWFAEIGKHKSQCIRDRSIACGCGDHVKSNAQDGISRRSLEAKPVPRACSTLGLSWTEKEGFGDRLGEAIPPVW